MKIALIGYGRMGHMVEQIARSRGHDIVCCIDRDNMADFDAPAFSTAEAAIEFTTPSTARDNVLRAWSHHIPVVSGTTGWNPRELAADDAQCVEDEGVRIIRDGKTMLVWKSNFSIGVNVLFELNKQLATLLAPYTQYAPSVTEVHHVHKLDKPSGTAKTLVEGILQMQSTPSSVPIQSIREGEVPGIHTITWDSPEDTIVVQHIAKGRQGFALGAVLAAEEIIKA